MILSKILSKVSEQDQLSGGKDGGVESWAGCAVHPVQVHTPCVCPIMAPEHPIGVQHRRQLKDIFPAEGRRPWILLIEEELEDAQHHIGGAGLSGVNSCREEDHLLPREDVGPRRLLDFWEESRRNKLSVLGDGVDGADRDQVEPPTFKTLCGELPS